MMKVGIPSPERSVEREIGAHKRRSAPRSPLATSQFPASNVAPALVAPVQNQSSPSSVGEVAASVVDCTLEVAGAVIENLPLVEIAGGVVEAVSEVAGSILSDL